MQIRTVNDTRTEGLNVGIHLLYDAIIFLTAFIAARAALRSDLKALLHCAAAVILFYVPTVIKRRGIVLPNGLEGSILILIFMSQVIGEAECGYVKFRLLDSALHLLSGFFLAAFGFLLPKLFSNGKNTGISPVLCAVFALCFSLSVGVFWELFEFSADRVLDLDMQKDTMITGFSTVTLDESENNIPVKIENVVSVDINDGETVLDGYLDIGLYDTMKDLFMNLIGAAAFSFIGYMYIEYGKFKHTAEAFIPEIVTDSPPVV